MGHDGFSLCFTLRAAPCGLFGVGKSRLRKEAQSTCKRKAEGQYRGNGLGSLQAPGGGLRPRLKRPAADCRERNKEKASGSGFGYRIGSIIAGAGRVDSESEEGPLLWA